MNIQITSHPSARPCVFPGEIVNLEVVGVDNADIGNETYQWVQDGEDLVGATGSTYAHTTLDSDYGSKIQCNISGRLSNAVELLPLEPMNPVAFQRPPVPYSFMAGDTATLAFVPVGTNLTYEVYDPTETLIAGPTACFNGYPEVFTTGADPAEGMYTVKILGDAGDASVSVEIRAFSIDEELLLWTRKHSINSGALHQVGYNDLGSGIQFGQIERSGFDIQQFTADENDEVVMRLVGNAQLPGALASQEVSIDGLFYTVLEWDADTLTYRSTDPHFANHMRGLPEFGIDSSESAVLDFGAFGSDTITISAVGYGGFNSDYVYGKNPDLGTGTLTTTYGELTDLVFKDPAGQTTTEIYAKFDDSVDIQNRVSMELTSVFTGAKAYLRRIPEEEGQTENINRYSGVSDSNAGLDDNLARELKIHYLASGLTPVTSTGDVVPTLVTDANTVDSVDITEVGAGYTSAPAVTFSTGTGATATGTAVMTGTTVTGIAITDPGSYLDAELPITVTIDAPAPAGSVDLEIRMFN